MDKAQKASTARLVISLRELADEIERRGIIEYHMQTAPNYHVGVDESGCRESMPGAGQSIDLEFRWADIQPAGRRVRLRLDGAGELQEQPAKKSSV